MTSISTIIPTRNRPTLLRETLASVAKQDVADDEVYEEFVYEGDHAPAARFDRDGRVMSLFGFSKSFAMTGWRLGYALASTEIAGMMARLAEPFVSSPSSLSQKAGEAALAGAFYALVDLSRGEGARPHLLRRRTGAARGRLPAHRPVCPPPRGGRTAHVA